MQCYAFIENDKINGVGQCKLYNPTVQVVEITEEIFNKYIEDPLYYTWNGKEVIVNPNYDEIKASQREEEFNANFFYTHLGYVKREVTMRNGAVKDFLTDLRSSLVVGLPVYTYDKPDFTQEVTQEILMQGQHLERIDQTFLNECDNQFAIDFYGFNPLENLVDNTTDETDDTNTGNEDKEDVEETDETDTTEEVDETDKEDSVEEVDENVEKVIEPFEEITPLEETSEEGLDKIDD
jgi:hypothetical protein